MGAVCVRNTGCGAMGLAGGVGAGETNGRGVALGMGALVAGRGETDPGAAGRAMGRAPKSLNMRRSGRPGADPGRPEDVGTGRPGPTGRGLFVKSIRPP